MNKDELRKEILRLTAEYYRAQWGEETPFVPGESRVPYGGRVFDEKELLSLIHI